MFGNVIIDFNPQGNGSGNIDPREMRVAPFLYLIADKITEAGTDFVRTDALDFIQKTNTMPQGRPHSFDRALDGEGVYFSPVAELRARAMITNGLDVQYATLILAAAGLNITIPSLKFDVAKSEELAKIRDNLADERGRYAEAMIRMADETIDRLKSGAYKDTFDWALNETYLKITPKALAFDRAIGKLNRSLLKRVSLGFVKEGIPNIGSAATSGSIGDVAKTTFVELLKALSNNLALAIEERTVPEVVYGYKINKEILAKGL